jgi:hypothetical protein
VDREGSWVSGLLFAPSHFATSGGVWWHCVIATLYISLFSPREQFFNNTLKNQSKLLETVTHAIPT